MFGKIVNIPRSLQASNSWPEDTQKYTKNTISPSMPCLATPTFSNEIEIMALKAIRLREVSVT